MSTTNEQVAHLWAHRQAGSTTHLSTDGTTLTSYYTAIAIWHTDAAGQDVAFISSNNMSATTGGKHLNPARRAVSYQYFATPAFHYGRGSAPTAVECITAAAKIMPDAFKSLCRQRTGLESGIERYTERRREILQTAARFNVTVDPASIPEATGDLKARARQFAEQEREARKIKAARQAAELAARQEADAAAYTAWIETGASHCPASYGRNRWENNPTSTDRLTVRNNDTVITSQGAEAPLDHVIKALAFYDSPRGRNYQTNGHKIPLGHFTLDSIDAAGNVKAGCHYITAAEIARFRAQWGI